MLQLLDKNKNKIAGLKDYKDLCIESTLSNGDKALSFLYPSNSSYSEEIQEEGYIRTKDQEYVIKEITPNDFLEVRAVLNLETLEGEPIDRFESVEQPLNLALNLALVRTGWTVGKCSIDKKRTLRVTKKTAYEVIQDLKKLYRVDIVFNTLTKTIDIYEKLGNSQGTYFIEALNIQSLAVQSNSYDFYTRIKAEGKDGLTFADINGGKDYIENYQYSNKVKTLYWSDDRYTIKESLLEDAKAKLDEMSKPFKSYSVDIVNLAKADPKNKDIFNYGLGDEITLISRSKRIKEKQRIVKIVEYPQNPEKDSVELANTVLRFEDLQAEFEETTEVVDNITNGDGSIDGSTIDEIETSQIKDFSANIIKVTNLEAVNATINNLSTNKADIQDLNAVRADIGTLSATKADITDLNASNANIGHLQANKADIVQLEAVTAKVYILEANTGHIKDLVSGNISSENIQSGGITGDNLNMSTINVADANIISLNANKINAGEIDTSKVKVKSKDGAIEIAGATQQFRDKNNKVRIQMGQDASKNFNFILRGEDGTTTLIDHTGIKENAIADNLIKENMVAENSVGEKQINYNSFATGFNKDTNTTSLKATKVQLDNQKQSLEVAFNSLKTQSDNNKNKTESNTTKIEVEQGRIATLIKDTTIEKDGKTLKLKDEYNKTVNTVNSMNNTINSHTTKIDANTGKITGVESKTNVLERDLNSMSSKLSATETKIDTMQLGTRNYVVNSDFSKGLEFWNGGNGYAVLEGLKFQFLTRNNYVEGNPRTFLYQSLRINSLKDKTIKKNTDVTISGYYYIGTSVELTGEAQIFVRQYDENNTNLKDLCSLTLKTTHTKGKAVFFTATGKLPHASNYIYFYLALQKNGHVGLALTKLEFSTKNSDWSAAPEDIQEQFKDASVEINSTKNKVSNIEQNIDSITQTVSSTQKEVTTVKNNLDNLQIGGRNTFRKNNSITRLTSTPTIRIPNEYAPNGFWITGVENVNNASVRINNVIKNNGWWTFSGWIKTNVVATINCDACDSKTFNITTTKINTWTKFECTFEITNHSDDVFHFIDLNNLKHVHYYFKDVKIETGKKATDCTPAPEDVSQEIQSVTTEKVNAAKAEIKVETDSIKQSVSSTQSEITTVNNNLNNLQVGGRNIVKGTDFEITTGYLSGKEVILEEINKLKGKQVTISVDVEINNGVSSTDNGRVGAEFSIEYEDGSLYYVGVWERITTTAQTVKRRISNTAPIKNVAIKKINGLGVYIQRTTGGTFKAGYPKVEAGNKMSGWSPAYEDIKSEIVLHESRIQNAENKITPTAITSTVLNSQQYKDDKGNVYTKEQANSVIEQKANSIKSEISSSGGGNLIENSSFNPWLEHWETFKYDWNGGGAWWEAWDDNIDWVLDGTRNVCLRSESPESVGELGIRQRIKLKKYQDYTFTVLVAQHRADNRIVLLSDSNEWLASNVMYESEGFTGGKDIRAWKKVTLKFNSGDRTGVTIYLEMVRSGTNGHVWYCQPMLNEGTISLAWNEKPASSSYVAQQLSSHSIINKVTESLSNGGKIQGVSTVLDKDKFMVKDSQGGSCTIDNGAVYLKNGNNVPMISLENRMLKCYNRQGYNNVEGWVQSLLSNDNTGGIGLFAAPGNGQKVDLAVLRTLNSGDSFDLLFRGKVGRIDMYQYTVFQSSMYVHEGIIAKDFVRHNSARNARNSLKLKSVQDTEIDNLLVAEIDGKYEIFQKSTKIAGEEDSKLFNSDTVTLEDSYTEEKREHEFDTIDIYQLCCQLTKEVQNLKQELEEVKKEQSIFTIFMYKTRRFLEKWIKH